MPNDIEKAVWEALRGVRFPGMSRDIVSFGFVDQRRRRRRRGRGSSSPSSTHSAEAAQQVRAEARDGPGGAAGRRRRRVAVELKVPPARGEGAQQAIAREPAPHSRRPRTWWRWRAARAGSASRRWRPTWRWPLARLGYRVGPARRRHLRPLGAHHVRHHTSARGWSGNRVLPFERYGVKLMSLGFILDTDTPVIWRGPMVMKAIEQMLGDVEWGDARLPGRSTCRRAPATPSSR